MLEIVTSEATLITRVADHYNDYFWNRCIVTGVSRSGKTTFSNKITDILGLKVYHSPNFEMSKEDTYMFLKYVPYVDRWFNWDRYVFVDKPPILDQFSHNILPIIFLGKQYDLPDTRDSKRQYEKYEELAHMMEPEFEKVILYRESE